MCLALGFVLEPEYGAAKQTLGCFPHGSPACKGCRAGCAASRAGGLAGHMGGLGGYCWVRPAYPRSSCGTRTQAPLNPAVPTSKVHLSRVSIPMHGEHALCSRDFKIAAPSPQQVLRQGLGSLSKSLLHLTLSPALVTCGERCPEEESSQRLGGLVQVTQLECTRTGARTRASQDSVGCSPIHLY